jgi:putative flippase GtrA
VKRDDLRRIARYIAVGLGSVAIDAIVYAILLSVTDNTLLSKGISYVTGAIFSYFANWRFTFGARRGKFSEVAFVLVYLSSLAVNLGVNELFLIWFGDEWWRAPLAFFITTGFTTVWNYIGMSLFVFRTPKLPEVVDEAIDEQKEDQ